MRKTVKKQIWMSPKEAEELADKAKRCGMSEAGLVRLLLSGCQPKEKPGEEFYQAMREFRAVGNNLNQILIRANTLRFIDAPRLSREMDKLNQLELKIERKFLVPEENELWQ